MTTAYGSRHLAPFLLTNLLLDVQGGERLRAGADHLLRRLEVP